MATKAKTYDPGTPGEILPIGRDHFAVESFKTSGQWYAVDIKQNTCTCPDFQYRASFCKHQEAAHAFNRSVSPPFIPVLDPDDDPFGPAPTSPAAPSASVVWTDAPVAIAA